jgi:hypothetical protein
MIVIIVIIRWQRLIRMIISQGWRRAQKYCGAEGGV